MNIKTVTCPVCKTRVLPVGLRNHIIGRARQEVYKWYVEGEHVKIPHQSYVKKNLVLTGKRKLKV